MRYLALVLCGLSIAALVAGLVNPAFMGRRENPSPRVRPSLAWGLAAAVCLLGYFLLARLSPGPSAPGAPDASAPGHPSVFSRLDITAVTAGDGTVTIAGATDLPGGAVIVVDFDVASPGPESETAVSAGATVTGGTFSVTVEPPSSPEFDTGPYTVTALFSPRSQPPAVLALTGENGENLAGPLAHDTFGFRVLETARKFALDLRPSET